MWYTVNNHYSLNTLHKGVFRYHMTIKLPEQVSHIIGRLEAAGYEAYAVGGCVRDSLLKRTPNDWDITTSALPEETKALFPRTIDTGIEHGTVTIMIDREGYEVTTYRIDGKYSDSRHPDSVSFTRSLEEDLKRRDFTINAMAYCDAGLIDMFGGVDDLDRHIVRCVGNPIERFGEDALRILRAVRFAAQLGFDIDPATAGAAKELAPNLKNISAERIHTELHKLLMSPHPDRLLSLYELGISDIILPEFTGTVASQKADELTGLLSAAPEDKYIRWALLLLYTGSARAIMSRLKFDNLTIHTVLALIKSSSENMDNPDITATRRLMCLYGKEHFPLILAFRHALEPDKDFSVIEAHYSEICRLGQATSVRELAVNGTDLIAAGFPTGQIIGTLLDTLLNAVIVDPDLNTPSGLLAIAREEFEKLK